jgi:diacylglycerol kinase family enzyme
MYVYFYDSSLNARQWANTLAKIETRLTNLGISGKIYRLSPLRNLEQLIDDEIRAGAQTLVAVGNDATVTALIPLIARRDATLGIIPLGQDTTIASQLGIPSSEEACNTLAARKLERLDLGRINLTYFLGGITISGAEISIECDDRYTMAINDPNARVAIRNLPPLDGNVPINGHSFDPQDGYLEIFIQSDGQYGQRRHWWSRSTSTTLPTIIPFKKIVIRSKESVPVIADGQRVHKTPVKVEVIPKKLKVIVGKDRLF